MGMTFHSVGRVPPASFPPAHSFTANDGVPGSAWISSGMVVVCLTAFPFRMGTVEPNFCVSVRILSAPRTTGSGNTRYNRPPQIQTFLVGKRSAGTSRGIVRLVYLLRLPYNPSGLFDLVQVGRRKIDAVSTHISDRIRTILSGYPTAFKAGRHLMPCFV